MRPHEPSEESRKLVALHAAIGTPQDQIAIALDIDTKTLRKHYRAELDKGMLEANAKVGGALLTKCEKGDTTAMIWWTKTRMGWSERVVNAYEGAPPLNISIGTLPAKGELKVTRGTDG